MEEGVYLARLLPDSLLEPQHRFAHTAGWWGLKWWWNYCPPPWHAHLLLVGLPTWGEMRSAGLHPTPGACTFSHHKLKRTFPSLWDTKSHHDRHERAFFSSLYHNTIMFQAGFCICETENIKKTEVKSHTGYLFPFIWIQMLVSFRKTSNIVDLVMLVHPQLTSLLEFADVQMCFFSLILPTRWKVYPSQSSTISACKWRNWSLKPVKPTPSPRIKLTLKTYAPKKYPNKQEKIPKGKELISTAFSNMRTKQLLKSKWNLYWICFLFLSWDSASLAPHSSKFHASPLNPAYRKCSLSSYF